MFLRVFRSNLMNVTLRLAKNNKVKIFPNHKFIACNYNLTNVRNYCKNENSDEKLKLLSQEIENIQKEITTIKSNLNKVSNKKPKEIKIEEGKFEQSDDEELIYRLAYDFPGFKSKNINVSIYGKLLKIYAFQSSNKKDTKEYIYENTTEEILPDEVDENNVKATFDSENGFLIIEALLPENSNLKEITKLTKEKNDKLYKLEKDLEKKKKDYCKTKA